VHSRSGELLVSMPALQWSWWEIGE